MTNGGDPKLKYWSVLLMIGSGMIFVAFFRRSAAENLPETWSGGNRFVERECGGLHCFEELVFGSLPWMVMRRS